MNYEKPLAVGIIAGIAYFTWRITHKDSPPVDRNADGTPKDPIIHLSEVLDGIVKNAAGNVAGALDPKSPSTFDSNPPYSPQWFAKSAWMGTNNAMGKTIDKAWNAESQAQSDAYQWVMRHLFSKPAATRPATAPSSTK